MNYLEPFKQYTMHIYIVNIFLDLLDLIFFAAIQTLNSDNLQY